MFAEDRGWTRRLQEAIRNGLTAEAAVERVQSDTRAQHGAADRSVPARPAARFRRPRQPAAARADGPSARALRRRPAGGRRSSSRATWGRRSCSTTTASGCAAWCSRRAGRPATSRSSRARSASPRSASSTTSWRWPRRATPIIVDGDTGEVHLRPPADIETAYADKVRFRARRQEQYRLLRDEPSVTARRRRRSRSRSMPAC